MTGERLPENVVLTNASAAANSFTNFTSDDDYIVSEQVYRYILLITGGFVTFGVTMIGIPGNVINCVVFWRQGVKDRTNLCLFSLAVVDLLYVAYALVWSCTVLLDFYGWLGFDEEHYVNSLRVNLGVTYGLRATSGLFSLLIAVDRCACVLFPLRVASFVRTRTVGVMLAAMAVLPQLGFAPLPLKYEVSRVQTPAGLRWQLVPSRLWFSHRQLVDAVLYSAMSVALPVATFAAVSVATLVTVLRLRAAAFWRQKSSSSNEHSHSRQTSLTKMLVLTSCVYIATMAPYVSLIITHLIIPEFSTNGRYVNLYLAYYTLANTFPFTNSAFVVFIYYSRSSRFRSELSKFCFVLRYA